MKDSNRIISLLKYYFDQLHKMKNINDREKQCIKIMNCVLFHFSIIYNEFRDKKILDVIYRKCFEIVCDETDEYRNLKHISLEIINKFNTYDKLIG